MEYGSDHVGPLLAGWLSHVTKHREEQGQASDERSWIPLNLHV